MSDNLILDYPLLKKGGGDFSTEVSYSVEAHRTGPQLHITHALQGKSFIRKMLENDAAKFSALLLYRGSAERYNHMCDAMDLDDSQATATQTISIDGFSYAPEIMPCIVALKDEKITVDNASGLSDFWAHGETFVIPAHSRIALSPKLKFTSGDVAKLMKVIHDKKLGFGEMKVIVHLSADEGEAAVLLHCGRGVFDQLHKINQAPPSNPAESMRSAIITQALTATYAHMQNLHNDQE